MGLKSDHHHERGLDGHGGVSTPGWTNGLELELKSFIGYCYGVKVWLSFSLVRRSLFSKANPTTLWDLMSPDSTWALPRH